MLIMLLVSFCGVFTVTFCMSDMLSSIASDVDYQSTSGEVVFDIGECTKDINITILVNPETEIPEIFNVALATDCCADITTGTVQVTITEFEKVTGNSVQLYLTVNLLL